MLGSRQVVEQLSYDGLADFIQRASVAGAVRERERVAAEQRLMEPFEQAQLEMLLNDLDW